MSESNAFDDFLEEGLCAICGKPTVRQGLKSVDLARGEDKEPFVCNRCLVDLRGDMATELEVRRQLTNLEAKTQGLETKLWNQSLAFNVVLAVGSFLAGVLTSLFIS